MSTDSQTITSLAVANHADERVDDTLVRPLTTNTRMLDGTDAIRSELRSTEIEIRAGASMIRDVATINNVRTYGFVLDHPWYQGWLLAAGSAILGIVGSGATGKTIISGLIYDSIPAILKALIWSIFDRRPDLALVKGRNDKWWAARIREANNRIPALWNLVAKLARRINTIWLILDSVHDCDDAVKGLMQQFFRASGRTSMWMKIVATSRSSERFTEANIHNWLAYSAADLEAGVDRRRYRPDGRRQLLDTGRAEPAAAQEVDRGRAPQPRAADRPRAAGRQPPLAADARRRPTAAFSLCVYGAVVESPATCSVADIQAMIAPTYPGTTTQGAIRDVLDARLQGLFAAANGDYTRATSEIKACQLQTVQALRIKAESVW
ncbi:hypothetical protein PG994_008189 [Apiospora phragmitis]|uniref:Uncharacterized protein n=1 Tax=Apiospora phragmitis TaxID=2905665 RepID=A0ABR1USC4_9PEZI